MAATPARELLQICSLSWVPGCIRGLWPGPRVWPRVCGLGSEDRSLEQAAPSQFTPSELAPPEVMLPPKGPSVPALPSGVRPPGLVLPAYPMLPAGLSRKRGSSGGCPFGWLDWG